MYIGILLLEDMLKSTVLFNQNSIIAVNVRFK